MSQPNGERLDSWKEIAAYLGRDLRTVRRWEEKGLPVRRVPGGERRAVFAYRREIDAWMTGQRDAVLAPAVPSLSTIPVKIDTPGSRVSAKRVLFALALCGLVAGAYLLWREFYGGSVASVVFSGNSLVARNQRGVVVWRYHFEQPLVARFAEHPENRITTADLGPDRKGDLLVSVPWFSPDRADYLSDSLFCFSAQGKLRWRHAFEEKPRFGEHEYASPWLVEWPGIGGFKEDRPIIWAVALQGFGAASTLTKLDPDGNQLALFVNWGHIATLKQVSNGSGSYILVGGISNQCNCAMLAVVREDSPWGSSPSLEAAYACENCPQGRPYRYFLFPKSELTLLSGTSYNNLRLIHSGNGHVWLAVSETDPDSPAPGPNWIKYDLSEDFVPASYAISDHFWTLHRQMEAEGKIHHTVEQCPERSGPRKVQMWSAERGWEWISVPKSTER
jgi:hypothetical protein